MASPLNPPFRSGTNILFYEPLHFQRGNGTKKIKNKKIKKKINLKFIHIFLFFVFIGAIFYSFQQFFLFLMSWDYLNIKEINIICSREGVKKEIEQSLGKKRLSNILLADIGHLQQVLKAHRWVEEAQIRKIFPNSLRIEIKEREPVAILKKEYLYLVDEKGIQLEKIYSTENLNLPLLIDSNKFQKNYEEKLILAWECLKNLSSEEIIKIKALDLTYFGWTTLYLKEKKTKIILSYNNFSQMLKFFLNNHKNLEARFGTLEYVDLRFNDRIYIKPQKGISIPNSKKEAL